jgi:hypothetical protein
VGALFKILHTEQATITLTIAAVLKVLGALLFLYKLKTNDSRAIFIISILVNMVYSLVSRLSPVNDTSALSKEMFNKYLQRDFMDSSFHYGYAQDELDKFIAFESIIEIVNDLKGKICDNELGKRSSH